jgi:hypothetical protein
MSLPRRISKETQRLSAEPVPGICATPYEDNLRYFNVAIAGPAVGTDVKKLPELDFTSDVSMLSRKGLSVRIRHIPPRTFSSCGLSYGPSKGET